MKKGFICTLALCCSVLLSGCSQEKKHAVTYDSVDSVIAEAALVYEEGSYIDALALYADAYKTNPLSIDALIGAARCQMALENYAMASENLSSAARIDPLVPEIYDAYLELSESSGSPGYARTAVNLAKSNHMDSFLERVPDEPQLSLEEGEYDSRQELTVTAPEGTEIMITERNGNTRLTYPYDGEPIRLLSGETTITAYCAKDGIPSDEVTAVYKLQIEPSKISFADPLIEAAALDALDMESGPITDLDCESVTYLNCYFNRSVQEKLDTDEYELKTFDDLKYFPKLQTIRFSNTEIKADLRELSTCRRITQVYFSQCGIEDISFVRSLKRLQSLDVYSNDGKLTDISPLADCENFVRLSLSDTGVNDLSPLYDKKMSQLTVSLSDKITGSVIETWKDSLVSLQLYNCGGKDLSWLGQFTGLNSLSLYSYDTRSRYSEETKPLKGMDFLKELVNLQNLYLYGLDDLSFLENVKSLKNLSYLYFSMFDRKTEIPSELIEDLQKNLSNCRISY